MKKITMGNCPYVVNMVGCCTLQEPLALVLEYIPNGDLLTYLKTIRKLVSISIQSMDIHIEKIQIQELLANVTCSDYYPTCF